MHEQFVLNSLSLPLISNKILPIGQDPATCYKVTTSTEAHRIFENIDRHLKCLPNAKQSINEYAKKVESFIRRNSQPCHEFKMRLKIYQLLRNAIEPHFNSGYLALGGSTLNLINSYGADLDLCFAIKSSMGLYDEDISPYVLSKIKYILDEKPFVANVRYIPARVPILKINLGFPYENVEIDINCNCVAGIFNSHLIHHYSKLDIRFVQMNIMLKQWGKIYDVISPRRGKINSYTMTLMILHFLQCGVCPPILPNLYNLFPKHFDGSGDVDKLVYDLDFTALLPKIPVNTRTIGELIYGFFEYFSRFKYAHWWISIKEATIFGRSEQSEQDRQFLFYLEEAYDGMTVPKNLTVRYKLEAIVAEFQRDRSVILADLFGPEFPAPTIDTSCDYVCELAEQNEAADEPIHNGLLFSA